MKKEITNDEIIKAIQRQYIAFILLLIAIFGGFMYLSDKIIDLGIGYKL